MEFQHLLTQFANEMFIEGKSKRTIQIYCHQVNRFFSWFQKDPKSISLEVIKNYQNWMVKVAKMSWSNFNQSVCALKYFIKRILYMELDVKHITYHRKEQKHPTILNYEEIRRLLAAAKDKPRWYCAISLFYGTGIRLSELCMLEMSAIDGKSGIIQIRQGKGAKDRINKFLPMFLGIVLRAILWSKV